MPFCYESSQGGPTGAEGGQEGVIGAGQDDVMVLAGLTGGSWVEANAFVDFFPARVLNTNDTGTNQTSTNETDTNGSDDTDILTSSSSDSSSSSAIIGAVFAVIAVVAVIVAGVCLRRRQIAKKTKGDAHGGAPSSDIPRAVERPRFTSISRSIPSVGDLPVSDAPRVVERPRVYATSAREVPPKGDLPPPPPGEPRPTSQGGYDVAKAVLEIAHKLARQSQCPGVSEAATLVSTLVNLISDGRSSSADVDARLKKCRLLVTMLERAAMVLGKVRGLVAPLHAAAGYWSVPPRRACLHRREMISSTKKRNEHVGLSPTPTVFVVVL